MPVLSQHWQKWFGVEKTLNAPSELQKWFDGLFREVRNFYEKDTERFTDDENKITSVWIDALNDPTINEYLRNNSNENINYSSLKKEVDEFVRRGENSVYLGVKNGDSGSLKFNFLKNAWPENRILGYILRQYLTVIGIDYEKISKDEYSNDKFERDRSNPYGFQYTLSSSEFLNSTFLMDAGNTNENKLLQFKYVINSSGQNYSVHPNDIFT